MKKRTRLSSNLGTNDDFDTIDDREEYNLSVLSDWIASKLDCVENTKQSFDNDYRDFNLGV